MRKAIRPMSETKPSVQSPALRPLPLPARVEPHVDTYFGRAVADPYRWMESSEHQTELHAWMRRHGEHTAGLLRGSAHWGRLQARLQTLMSAAQTVRAVTAGGDSLFFLKTAPGATLASLCMRDAHGHERVLIDPATLRKPGGQHRAIDNFAPSPDGRYVAYNLSEGGNEITQVHFFDTVSGRHLPDVLGPIWGEIKVTWLPHNLGVCYTQMNPQALVDPTINKLLHMKVRLHRLGTPTAGDVLLLGSAVNPTAPFQPEEFPLLQASPASDWLLAMGAGARAEFRILATHHAHLAGPQTTWIPIAEYDDKVTQLSLHGDALYYVTTKDAPYGELRRLALPAKSLADSVLLLPQGEGVLQNIVTAQDAIYFCRMVGGIFRLYRLAYDGGPPVEIALPFAGSLDLVETPTRRAGVLFSLEGWTQPRRYLTWEPGNAHAHAIGLADESPADFTRAVVHRTEAVSADGARVPLTVLALPEPGPYTARPTILTAYGAYGYSLAPTFQPALLAWLELGGVYAFAHVRGGGEKGTDWHRAGQGRNKIKGVQDLIACAEQLIQLGYSSPDRLAIRGVSMGGIVVGRTLTERPDLFAAATLAVGVLNPLRYLQMSNGANQRAELDAAPDSAAGVDVLQAMDPYLHIQAGGSYPPTLLVVGLNDERVSPWMSAKFAARLQATGTGRTVALIRTDDADGHGAAGSTRDQEIQRMADEWTFGLLAFHDAKSTRKDAATQGRPR